MLNDNTQTPEAELHPSDIAKALKQEYQLTKDTEQFLEDIKAFPAELLGDVLIELPDNLKEKVYENLSNDELASVIEEMETDDATDTIQEIEENDEEKAREIMDSLDKEDKEEIDWLKRYDEGEAGAVMQTELFDASLDETIEEARTRLRERKQEGTLYNIHQVFVTDPKGSLKAAIPLEELLIADFSMSFQTFLETSDRSFEPYTVQDDGDVMDVVKMFEDYDLTVVAVVGYKDKLLGRITSDDIHDIIETRATEQIYNLAGVNEEIENEENFIEIGKNRATWLGINLVTAILASIVIGFFEATISQIVALAVLMPIVASMGGNAGTQTLTVMVRQLALGEVDFTNSKNAVIKEVYLSLLNGAVFSMVTGLIAYFWFNMPMLGYVIALSMVINLFAAGFFGAVIPLILKRFDIDPAIGSTVILTTITDVVGFFSFLGLASIMLL
jgi:magnesium transporter